MVEKKKEDLGGPKLSLKTKKKRDAQRGRAPSCVPLAHCQGVSVAWQPGRRREGVSSPHCLREASVLARPGYKILAPVAASPRSVER